MRDSLDASKLDAFMRELGMLATGPGRVYIVGGGTAMLLGIRNQTIDIDLKMAPEPPGAFEAIAKLKEKLGVNVELAAPDEFIPPLPGWEARSEFIARYGSVDFFHYDFYAQALSKIQRGFDTDLSDAVALVEKGKVEIRKLLDLYQRIEPELNRYPAIRPESFRAQLETFAKRMGHA